MARMLTGEELENERAFNRMVRALDFNRLYDIAKYMTEMAPPEEACSEEENEVYACLCNLKCALDYAISQGYGESPKAGGKQKGGLYA